MNLLSNGLPSQGQEGLSLNADKAYECKGYVIWKGSNFLPSARKNLPKNS